MKCGRSIASNEVTIPAPAIALPIPGTSSLAHLRENLAVARLTLPAEAVRALDAIAG